MPVRRGHGEGQIRKHHDGRWEARYYLSDGKRRSLMGKTRKEVADRLRQALDEQAKGLPVQDEKQTVKQYMESWYESVLPQLRGSSLRRYGDYVRIHIVPSLGKYTLAKLSPQHVQLFYSRKVAEGLSTSTVSHIHGMLHRAIEDAVRMGLVQRNITDMVRAPRRGRQEMITLSEEQAQAFLDATANTRYAAVFVLALTTGMRAGELFGLRWADVDFDKCTLQVQMNLQETPEGPFILAETKTSYSRRTIALTNTAVKALRAHRVKQNEDRLTMGDKWNSELDLVFPNAWGGINNPDNFVKRFFKPVLKKLGLPPEMRLHDLRHSCATILLARGVHPKVVSELLGHADISITLRIYAHVTPHMQQAAVAVMDGLFDSI